MSLRAFALLMGALMLAPIPIVAGSAEAPTAVQAEFLVGFEPGEGLAATAAVRAAGGNVLATIASIDTLVVRLPVAAATTLATRSAAISFVERNVAVRAAGVQWNGAQWDGAQWDGAQWDGAQWDGAQWDGAQWNGAQWDGAQWDGTVDPGLQNGWQWGVDAVRAPDAWTTEGGRRSANVCVVDSGVDASHRDLSPYVTKRYNAIDNSSNVSDGGGHGTHVAGIAAATHMDGWGIAGLSNSTIFSAKVLGVNGTGSASALARGITWCVDKGADLLLMALSLQGASLAVGRAIDIAASKDVVMVASAGNTGPCSNCVAYPARDPNVIAVAASDRSGALASFSSNGPEVAIRAPGVGILSTLPSQAFGYGSGTSQAAAFVAGTAALLLESKPSLSAAEVRAAIAGGGSGGVLDAAASLALVTPPPAPTAATEPIPTEETLVTLAATEPSPTEETLVTLAATNETLATSG